jgi:hypothetical protein
LHFISDCPTLALLAAVRPSAQRRDGTRLPQNDRRREAPRRVPPGRSSVPKPVCQAQRRLQTLIERRP